MTEKHSNDDSGIGSPFNVRLEDERNGMSSHSSCFQQSPTTESTNMNDSELISTETEAFQRRGDVDHVFTGSVKCELCDFRPTRLFQYYHHIIEHCKQRGDLNSDTDPAQALNNFEFFHNGNHSPEEIENKKKKRRKNVKPKKCKISKCDFETTKGCDVTEAKKELWMHMRKNHQYPLVCRLCPFVTEPKHHMVYHWLGEHTKLRPFKCEESNCSYSCVAKSMLNSHVVRHWEVFQYNCLNCNFKARLHHVMKKHMRDKKHENVLILNEDGSQNVTAFIDMYSKKRGPRRNTTAKNQDQSDLNQSSPSSTASSEPPEILVSHSEALQQQQSVELNSNINKQLNSPKMHSLLPTLHYLSDIITNMIFNNKNNLNPISWNYLFYMFNQLFDKQITPYINIETIDPQNRLNCLFVMKRTIDWQINEISKIDHNNCETINSTEAGPSSANNNVNHISDRLSITNGLKYQPETQEDKTQNISLQVRDNFKISNSEASFSDHRKYTNQTSISNKRKAEPEELDDIAMTNNDSLNLTHNRETDSFNKIYNKFSTSEELESQSQIQRDQILNKPLSINKVKITGAVKRKSKTQTRFVAREDTRRSKIESLMDSDYDLQRKSQIDVTINNINKICTYCDITFGNNFMYNMHMNFHTINNPYKCNLCGESCTDSVDFNRHLINRSH